jgi:hypothetical protein
MFEYKSQCTNIFTNYAFCDSSNTSLFVHCRVTFLITNARHAMLSWLHFLNFLHRYLIISEDFVRICFSLFLYFLSVSCVPRWLYLLAQSYLPSFVIYLRVYLIQYTIPAELLRYIKVNQNIYLLVSSSDADFHHNGSQHQPLTWQISKTT